MRWDLSSHLSLDKLYEDLGPFKIYIWYLIPKFHLDFHINEIASNSYY